MFALLLIQFNQKPIRTRLIGGISVGFIILVLVLLLCYWIFCFDKLSRYVSKDTQIYLHFDARNASENFYKIKATDALLKHFELESIDRKQIGAESAVICDSFKGDIKCGLIIQAKNHDVMIKYLAGNGNYFRQLDSRTFIIGPNENWLQSIKKSHNPFRYFGYQGALGRYGALTLVLNQPKNSNNDILKIIHLADANGAIKMSGAVTGQGIVIRLPKTSNLLSFGQKKIARIAPFPDCDIAIASGNGVASRPLIDYAVRLFAGSDLVDISKLSNQPFSICMRKTGDSGGLIRDYDMVFQSKSVINSDQITIIEKILLNLAAKSYPATKSYFLNDGTKISELWGKPGNLSFESNGNERIIRINDQRQIFYLNSSQGLIIGNKIGLIIPKNLNELTNFISIRINSLPRSQFKDLISDFSYLIASGKYAVIK